MDFMDIEKKRVTVRKFSQKPVEDNKIQMILEAGRWSPTAVNYQPQRILVLNSPESLAKVREFCSFGYDQKYVDLAKECDDKEKAKSISITAHHWCFSCVMIPLPAGLIPRAENPAERQTPLSSPPT